MKFIEKISTEAHSLCGDKKVKAVYLGLSYCLSILENGDAGLAYIFKDELLAGCNIKLPKRPLAGAFAKDLLDFAGTSSIANSISLSVANALFSPLVRPSSHGDFIENFEIKEKTKVGMVGHFGPLEPLIRKQGADLTIFDLHPAPFSQVIDASHIPTLLPQCDVALLTATSIINETADDLLNHSAHCKYTAMIGPSTPLYPQCYTGTPVSCAGGSIVHQSDALIQAVVEGGGTRMFHPYLDKVNIML